MQEIKDILMKADFDKAFINYIENHLQIEDWDNFSPFLKDEDDPIYQLDPQERVFAAVFALKQLKEDYNKRNIPLEYFYDSIDNLNYRVSRSFNNYGMYQLSDSDCRWLSYIYFLEMFDIGSMRFQRFWFSYDEIERSGNDSMYLARVYKKQFPEGTPVINLHVNDGADISQEAVDASFAEAVEFFDKYFPEHKYKAFVARTWMFYPATLKLFSKDSNIYRLAQRFEIIGVSQNRWQALLRIYGSLDLDEIKRMEKKSSLAKRAYKDLTQLGVAAGVIYRENILGS